MFRRTILSFLFFFAAFSLSAQWQSLNWPPGNDNFLSRMHVWRDSLFMLTNRDSTRAYFTTRASGTPKQLGTIGSSV
jgi:hypothetical protein